MSDPYVYPGSTVLKNKAGIRDPEKAARLERLKAQERYRQALAAIERGTLTVAMTSAGYHALHRHVFQDVYDWAGQARTVNIAKQDLFCLAPHIASELEKRFALIRAENELKGLSPEKFAERAAEHVSEINAIHPYREGNGRIQRLFLKALAHQAGHSLSLKRIEAETWQKASLESFQGDYRATRAIISAALTGLTQARNVTSSDGADPQQDSGAEEQNKTQGWKERSEKLTSRHPQGRGRGYKRGQ